MTIEVAKFNSMEWCAISDTKDPVNNTILACKECVYEICKIKHPNVKVVDSLIDNDK